MKITKFCEYCKENLPVKNGRVFSNHVRWCKKNLKNGDKGSANIRLAWSKRIDEKFGQLKKFQVHCDNHQCSTVFCVEEREKKYPERKKYFCSRSCANSKPMSEETKKKISDALLIPPRILTCLNCKKEFENKRNRRCCSVKCSNSYKTIHIDKNKLSIYRNKCQFSFNVFDYPQEFDIELIKKYGWYSAKNRKNNLFGVSRDHIVSVKYGFENNIDPQLLAHPANCRLLRHNENVSKGSKCDMSIDELLVRIKKWNEKYCQS